MLRKSLLVLVVASGLQFAQVLAQDPTSDGPVEIHVDERCRVYTQDRAPGDANYSRPAFRSSDDICRIDHEMKSKHWEGSIEEGIVKRTKVTVVERTYRLHDPAGAPARFLVEQSVPRGWHVDSDPQPVRMENNVAVFEVMAKPGQTVRLHVGIRN